MTMADLCAWDDVSGVFLIGEIKSLSGLQPLPEMGVEICSAYANNALPHNVRLAIAQLYGYMVDQRCKYGFLTNYNRTWFFFAKNEQVLKVSDAITCDSGELLKLIAFFMKKASDESSRSIGRFPRVKRLSPVDRDVDDSEGEGGVGYGEDLGRNDNPGDGDGDGAGAGGASAGAGSASGGFGTENSDNTVREGRKRYRDEEAGTSECETDAALPTSRPVCWDDLCVEGVLGEGRMGFVLSGWWKGVSIAIKMVDITKCDLTALTREKAAYRRLQHLQGRCIPRVVLWDVMSPSGNMMGLGLERLQPLPPEFDDWTPQQRQSADRAIKMLRNIGNVRQNDVRAGNFGISSESNEVLMIDLEDLVDVS
jgi:hypothetical protein